MLGKFMHWRTCVGLGAADKRIGIVMAMVCGLGLAFAPGARPSGQGAVQPRPVGTIKAISGNTITLTADSGGELIVQAEPNAKVLRVEPGQRDLKAATAVLFSELKPGDRVIARGAPSADGKVFLATSIITISKGDIAAKQAHEREEWQRHGVGGALLRHLRGLSSRRMLVGTWQAAAWAIRFYQRHGFALVTPAQKTRLLQTYWSIPERQIATSVVLANPPLGA